MKTPYPDEMRESNSTSMDTEAHVSTLSRGLAMRFRMPRLVVEIFTEMGGEKRPLGLTRFTLSEFFIAASMRSSAGLTHIEATLASLLLENLLPGLFPSLIVCYSISLNFILIVVLAL